MPSTPPARLYRPTLWRLQFRDKVYRLAVASRGIVCFHSTSCMLERPISILVQEAIQNVVSVHLITILLEEAHIEGLKLNCKWREDWWKADERIPELERYFNCFLLHALFNCPPSFASPSPCVVGIWELPSLTNLTRHYQSCTPQRHDILLESGQYWKA